MRSSILLAILLYLASTADAQQDTLIIHFDFNRTDIRPADVISLDSLLRTPGLTSIILAGHTDNTGSDMYNDRLSLSRAQAVYHFLQAKGLPDSLFKAIDGFGSHRPCDPSDPALNRRVEIIVTHVYVLPDIHMGLPNPVTGNIILHHVNFYGDRHTPLPESYPEMNELLTVMKRYPRMVIQIQGYVCCMADGIDGRDADDRSDSLSFKRAKFIYDFLVEAGIATARMSYRGFGASNKIYPYERDETERSANRRVEIKIMSFN